MYSSTIRDKIIPHAVSWFTGEAVQDEFEDIEDDNDVDENEDEDEEEDEDDEDDEDDDDDDEEEEEKGKKKVFVFYLVCSHFYDIGILYKGYLPVMLIHPLSIILMDLSSHLLELR